MVPGFGGFMRTNTLILSPLWACDMQPRISWAFIFLLSSFITFDLEPGPIIWYSSIITYFFCGWLSTSKIWVFFSQGISTGVQWFVFGWVVGWGVVEQGHYMLYHFHLIIFLEINTLGPCRVHFRAP